ncbi:MAG: flagellar basal body rod protein FlgB [Clostridiaceae bacterium]
MNISSSTYTLLKKDIDAASLRGKVIANNLANLNTKGYKKKTVSFEETLSNKMDNISLKTTNSKHIASDNIPGTISVKEDKSSSITNDGNNVDVDLEMVNMTTNNMLYESLITQLNSRMTMTKYVINGR